ncbi:MAG: EscU/YscU/HrcU family type III secretion system export apparatus switch protein, partial [Bacillota bacterium]|nr:EscU/YscU/HrcU family type III secretion system export apparatus switch protein [Bacillota bacterium]
MEEGRWFILDLQLFAGEATEPATPRRREEARKKGHVPRSHDLVTALLLLALMYLLRWSGGRMLEVMSRQTQELLAAPPGEITPATLEVLSLRLAGTFLQALWPVFLVALAVGILGNGLQVGVLFQTRSLQPDLNRINPLAGARRIFSKGALVELLKSLLKVLIVGGVAYLTVRRGWERLLLASEMALPEVLAVVGQMTFELVVR